MPFDIFNSIFRIDGEDIRIMLWDTAGQEEFDAITKAYYRGAQACVLAFSTTDRMSFEAVKDWKMKVGTRSTIHTELKKIKLSDFRWRMSAVRCLLSSFKIKSI